MTTRSITGNTEPRTTTSPPPVAKSPKGPVLAPNRFSEASFARNQWCATIPSDVSLEQVLAPGFWKVIGRRAKIGDEIVVRNDDITLAAVLLVVAADPMSNYIEVREVYSKQMKKAVVENEVRGDYTVAYEGLQRKWCVHRKLDGVLMKEGLNTRDDANHEVLVTLAPRAVEY